MSTDLDENERPGVRLTPERLAECLECWRSAAGTLTANQIRALLAWGETPYTERERLKASLAIIQQRHDSRLDRMKGIFRS